MRYSFIFFAAFSILAGGCESRPGQDDVDLDTTNVRYDTTVAGNDTAGGDVQRPADGEADDGSASLGVSLQALLEGAESRDPETQQLPILDRLNEPERVSLDTQANRHVPGQTDTLRTLHYDGATVTVLEASGKELMKDVTVTEPGLRSPQGVQVGMTHAEVENVLGEATERQDGAHVYEEDAPMPTRFYVYYENGDVSRMEWMFAID